MATAGQLLRLYPKLWRLRYQDEFLALLEATPITRAVVIDTVRAAAAAWEWIRWTRIGRVALAFAIAAPAAAVGGLLARAWPGPMGTLIHAASWQTIWSVIGLSSLPWLVGIALLAVTRPAHTGGPVPRFAAQLVILTLTSVAAQWLTVVQPATGSTPFQAFRGSWIGDGIYMSLFLTWLFNIEGGASRRYLRRVSGGDLV